MLNIEYMICTFMMFSHNYFKMLLDLNVSLIVGNEASKFSITMNINQQESISRTINI